MERIGRDAAPGASSDDAMAGDPAVRDATSILARASADGVAADGARERYRTEPMAALEPDARIAPLLAPDELVLAVRPSAVFDLPKPTGSADAPLEVAGDLYLTSRRLVLVGRVILSLDLREIEEVGVSGERLILIERDGSSVAVQAGQPRLLRVEIGEARAGLRA